MRLILTILAVLCFLLATFGQNTIGPIALVPLGLALFALSFLFENVTWTRTA